MSPLTAAERMSIRRGQRIDKPSRNGRRSLAVKSPGPSTEGHTLHLHLKNGWYLTIVGRSYRPAIIVDLFEKIARIPSRMSKQYVLRNYFPAAESRRQYFLNSLPVWHGANYSERLVRLKDNTAPNDTTKNAYGLTGKNLCCQRQGGWTSVQSAFPKHQNGSFRARPGSPFRFTRTADGHNVSLHQSVEVPMAGSDRPLISAKAVSGLSLTGAKQALEGVVCPFFISPQETIQWHYSSRLMDQEG